MLKTFISHSSKDKTIARELAQKFTAEKAWLDEWDMDSGDVLSDKIEKGIDQAKNFLILLSRDSINSRWVNYELNMALIKYLEEQDYRIIIARIDDVQVPLRLKPFLRIDCANSPSIADDIYAKLISNGFEAGKGTKRRFINRQQETAALQDLLYEPNVKCINVVGFHGIGKTSLVQETLKRVFSNVEYVEINLTPAYFGARLTIELCSNAGIELPPDGASKEQLFERNILALETILAKGNFIIFNRFESILNDNATPNEDILSILAELDTYDIFNERPIIILSTRWPDFSDIGKERVDIIKIEGLSEKHLGHILKNEIQRVSPSFKIDEEELAALAKNLHGYPLAARLAAPVVVKHGSISFLVQNMHIVNRLKIDIAEDIISKIELQESEIRLLELLAIFDHPINPFYLSEVANVSSEKINASIEILTSYNLLNSSGGGISLHPLVNDFYLKLAQSTSNFKLYADKLAQIAKNKLSGLSNTDKEYVYWLTSACRLLFYCGKLEEGKQLRRDLLGEIKDAAIKLYQNKEYKDSLKFSDYYLEAYPYDKDVLFNKARCLYRIGKVNNAVDILDAMIKSESSSYRKAKYYTALGMAYWKNSHENETYIDLAENAFDESLRWNEHQSALQGMADLLHNGRNQANEALAFIERKLELSPADPLALSLHADILWSLGEKPKAIGQIIEALKYLPKNPTFLFRAGRFMSEQDKQGAYSFYKKAIRYDNDYVDARLSLASTCIDLDYIDEAQKHLSHIASKLTGDKKTSMYQSKPS